MYTIPQSSYRVVRRVLPQWICSNEGGLYVGDAVYPCRRRVFLIVLDSFGIGASPDAAAYGDAGSNTLASIAHSPAFRADTLQRLGLFNVEGGSSLPGVKAPLAAYGRCMERSRGKDTTIGHWEIAGLISKRPLPVYPDGFPAEVLDAFTQATGRGVLCNRPYSGTQVLLDYGRAHLETGNLIVYTSADSVFQIAAHESLVPPEELYEICRKARAILTGRHAVGRVIARPFIGEYPNFTRTARRHDFSLEPPGVTMLDLLREQGFDTIAVGKINDIFAGRGVSQAIPTSGNAEGMERVMQLAQEAFHGLCFLNLVDFDMLYGHRNDVDGYAAALTAFDRWLAGFLPQLGAEDVLMITADHGCDPATPSTDHSREYTPLLVYGAKIAPVPLGTRASFADIGKTVLELLGVDGPIAGASFAGALEGGGV